MAEFRYKLGGYIFLFMIGAIIAIYFFSGLYGSDDSHYLEILISKLNGTDIKPSFWVARWLISVPLALYGYTLNLDPFFAVTLHSFQYVAFSVLSFYLLMKAYDFGTSFTMAILIVMCPLLYVHSGMIFPDVPLAFIYIFECILCILIYSNRLNINAGSVLLGALIGATYTLKEPYLIWSWQAPILCIALLIRDRVVPMRVATCIMAGLAAVVVVDSVTSRIVIGEFFPRLSMMSTPRVEEIALERISHQGLYPVERLIYISSSINEIWILGYLFVASSILSPLLIFVKKYRRFDVILLSLTLSSFMIMNIYVSFSLSRYLPLPLAPRYFIAGALVWCIVLGIIVSDIFSRVVPGRVGAAALAALFLGIASIPFSTHAAGNLYRVTTVGDFMRVVDHVQRSGYRGRIYATKALSARVLPYRLTDRVAPLPRRPGVEAGRGALLLVWAREKSDLESLLPGVRATRARDLELAGVAPATRNGAIVSALGRPDAVARRRSMIEVYRLQLAGE